MPALLPGELQLLEDLSDGTLERVEPVLDEDGSTVRYPDVEPYFRNLDEEPSEVVESMAERGLLAPENDGIACPCCGWNAETTDVSTACPDCESPDIGEQDVLEHLDCGCTKPRERFEDEDDSYRCPDCDAELEAIGVDYAKVGAVHVCDRCEGLFETPDERPVCAWCSTPLSAADASETGPTTYRFDEERTEWLQTHRFARDETRRYLQARGFSVELDAVVTGRSGYGHAVDVYASDETFGFEVVASVTDEVVYDRVLKFQAVASDVGAQPVLVALDEPSGDAIALAEEFGVEVVAPPAGTASLDADRQGDRLIERSSIR